MDKDTLVARQKRLQTEFEQLQASGNQKRTEVEQIEDELKRLQGKFAELAELIAEIDKKDKTPEPAVAVAGEGEVADEPKRKKG